jgi:hypothetical protein
MEDLSFLYDNYYRNINEFYATYNSMFGLHTNLDGWLSLVNSSYTQDGYLNISPLKGNTDYLNIYYEAKNSIKTLVLQINFNYDEMHHHLYKINNNYIEIKLRDYYFEGKEFNECEIDFKLMKKASIIINKTVTFKDYIPLGGMGYTIYIYFTWRLFTY